jgi:hypothetical protein
LVLKSFLFFKVSILRLTLSHVFSELFFSIISLIVFAPRLALSHVLFSFSKAYVWSSWCRLALSHVLSLAFLKSPPSDLLAILLYQLSFSNSPSTFLFPSKSPHIKKPKAPKQKPGVLFQWVFYSQW